MIFSKNIKFLPYGKHNITRKDISLVLNVLRKDNLTQGDKVPKFESLICQKVKANYAIALNSATSALHLTCLAIGLKENDLLWTSVNTFVASANCGRYCGATIDFVDIDPNTGLMDIGLLEKKLIKAEKANKLPKIIIPVHFAGTSCEMEKLFELSKKYKFHIIEDASHAIGGKYNNELIGNCKYSVATIFSFHPVKILTTGEGGVVTTNDKEIAKKITLLRSHGITKDSSEFQFKPSGIWSYEQQYLGYNYRMNDINAVLGISQIMRLEKIVQERNTQYIFYKKILKGLPIKFLEIPSNVYSPIHLAIIKLDNKSSEYHKEVFANLRKMKIGVQVHYIPVHLHPYYRNLGFSEGDFPQAELHAKNTLTIPLFVGLKKKDQKRVASCLKIVL